MKLIKIGLTRDDLKYLQELKDILHNECTKLRGNDVYSHIELKQEKEGYSFCCQFWPGHEHTADTFDSIQRAVSQAVAEYVVNYKEKEFLKEILIHEYGYEDENESDAIIHFILSLLNLDEHGQECGRSRRRKLKQIIVKRAEEYFQLENQLSIEGFVRFRLKEQWENWRQSVHHGADEYLMDKEHRDFIGFLRSLVRNQESQQKLIHIVHIDDQNLLLFDKDWERIYPYLVDGVSMEISGKQIRYEDLIIHTLISTAPKKIVLHTQLENHHIIYTIKKIFDHNVKICSLCFRCRSKMSKDISTR